MEQGRGFQTAFKGYLGHIRCVVMLHLWKCDIWSSPP